jgi:hypothetical protein
MRDHLLRWQWELYPEGHTKRATLVIHLMTTPLFMLGTLMLLASPLFLVSVFGKDIGGWHVPVVGVAFMLSTVMLQGWSHKQEDARPVAFLGPLDFVSRFFVEQWVTFPRYVASGALASAWRRAR